MISVKVINSVDDSCLLCNIDSHLHLHTAITPEIHKYVTDVLNKHYDRDIRFYLDFHRNYVEEDIFKGLV